MEKLIVANWKMNPGTQQEVIELFDAVSRGITRNLTQNNAEVVICPPFIYLPLLKGLTLGAQNVSVEPKGAFTSQVSATQLKDLGVEYVIVGHSESRKYLHETDEEISKKLKTALAAGLKPILCVGENEGEDRTEVLATQLAEGLQGLLGVIIAYEPVWAIGTDKNCDTQSVVEAAKVIKKIAGDVGVIYGGSVNAENAKQYLEVVDGLLVGGASLKPEEFINIVRSVD
ncbi:MAG: triose-phosphate isomerase [Candidatus Staskawiczbacteria bacterium RIFCSPHIGHO2_02_FULL_43_16]|uniref:Triosephosphate isomerase n=1 Tax=Candidatus Staskawiczbacteria bacterium RIFCSPHIGHO2_01_FULL_41_41 TaxID=1802203 RepID=A0A1G2HUK2_9BACT|nr:MAG: triose-phosphate isomerase [Candidatus Staskawiczbacteria bacterium RIFCSPHIGHO2_01_FULL_41_41]OGZ68275.1 MAG: triose-phosphate isomerase [Candidatus Staskawiczbacteria bacterium RIFCSPHIGHO2_02_FULL_43_16]OGZ74664.1 MAG: triose-phosphate isomerase [Candidatus Staskawiczbacteria bacterium RIFCSPLOWO2_01_FULL_43_17b]